MNHSIKTHHRILLTGAAGQLGQVLRDALRSNCDVLRLSDKADLGSVRPGEEVVQADLTDRAAIDRAVAGCDAIVHFGGISVEAPFEDIVQANILGLYHVYEAARAHGVRRVVFASSNHVVGFYDQGQTINADHPPRPDGFYGVSKAFGEDLSRMYFERDGIETACLRIGTSVIKPKDRRMLATWLSHGDLHRLISACLSTPVLGHSIVFGMSNNAVTWWDNSRARHVGFVPQDSSDIYRDEVFSQTPTPDVTQPVALRQGGAFVSIDARRKSLG